jgi:hypothetical protein
MKKLVFLIPVIILLYTCRKKSDISITAWNYALAEPIANAEVGIFEVEYQGGLFNAGTKCKEVAHATTDNEGKCFFNSIKLKKNKKVQYSAKVKYSYGKDDRYNCNVTENSEVKLGNNNLVLNNSAYDCFFKVQYNNLLNPSQLGDSLIVSLSTPKYEVPGQPYPFGGGGVFGASPYYGCNGFPFPPQFQIDEIKKSNAGKHVLKIYKKKMGIVSQTIDTVKIYPYETKTIEINW